MSTIIERIEVREAQLNEVADHWEKLADEAKQMAEWDRKIGIGPYTGSSPGDNKAETYRRVAGAIRLEAKTGVPHCQCHHTPTSKCLSQAQGRRK